MFSWWKEVDKHVLRFRLPSLFRCFLKVCRSFDFRVKSSPFHCERTKFFGKLISHLSLRVNHFWGVSESNAKPHLSNAFASGLDSHRLLECNQTPDRVSLNFISLNQSAYRLYFILVSKISTPKLFTYDIQSVIHHIHTCLTMATYIRYKLLQQCPTTFFFYIYLSLV